MKVCLADIDSKMPNLALMKLSAYHKGRGDTVKFYDPLFDQDTDLVYASKVFTFTPDWEDLLAGTVRGGPAYDLDVHLPDGVEAQRPDYSLYGCDYAMGYTMRGCVRNCPFCIVPKAEGKARPTGDIYDFWDGQERLCLLDNNLTALPAHFTKIVRQLAKEGMRVDFSQGLDVRLLTLPMAEELKKVRLWKQIHFAWDSMKDERRVRHGIRLLEIARIARKSMFYVLIGYDTGPEEDLYRVMELRALGVDPFVMPYDRADGYQKRFARWVNHKAIFKSVKWEDYRSSK